MQKESSQEAKYGLPYHYSYSEKNVTGIIYFSYLRKAADALFARAPGRALDAGCGDARFIAYLRERDQSFPVEGLDYSESALVFARFYNPGNAFTHASVESMPFPDRSFDAVSLIEVIEHMEPDKLSGVLAECKRILTEKGVIVITTPSLNERKMSRAHYQHFSKESLERYLEEAGLRLIHIEGNYKLSRLQIVCQGLMQNRFFDIRYEPLIRLYRRAFKRFWETCSVDRGRRLIAVAGYAS